MFYDFKMNLKSEIRLYFFTCGTLRCKTTMGLKLNDPLKEELEFPVPWFLLQHPKGNVIIDGGIAVECALNAKSRMGEIIDTYEPTFTPEAGCLAELNKLGIEQIDYVLFSHLHWDHTGAAGRFPNALHIVQRSEYEYAMAPDWFAANAYARTDFDNPNIRWYFLEGPDADSFDLFGDSVLKTILTPGHSVGHQSFLITVPNDGPILLSVDAAYTMDHWNQTALPVFATSILESVRSVQRLHQIARKTGAKIVTGHDPESWSKFKHAPEYYS
jgi:N-acyl homoserine lactone hydrolase